MNVASTRMLDLLGISVSMLCAIHCALVPLLLTLSAFSGLAFGGDPLVEWSMIILSRLMESEAVFTVSGAIILAVSHVTNWQSCKRCDQCECGNE